MTYVIIWLEHSGIQLHESHACADPGDATRRFNEIVKRAGLGGVPAFGPASPKDLEEGKRFVASNGKTTVHAFRVDVS